MTKLAKEMGAFTPIEHATFWHSSLFYILYVRAIDLEAVDI